MNGRLRIMAISDDDTAPIISPRKSYKEDRRKARMAKEALLVPAPLDTSKWVTRKYHASTPIVKTPKVVNPNKFGTCPLCDTKDVQLTKDHIVPQWVFRRLPVLFKMFNKRLLKRFIIGGDNIQYICSPCNNKKGGFIDCSHEIAREFWSKVRDAIDKELKKYEEKPPKDTEGLGILP